MGGGLLQLVAYGAQDVYLTGNPQITFFKVVYRRHTNFAIEAIQQTFNGNPIYGSTVNCQISRNGDLINRMYLQVDVEKRAQGQATAMSYVNYLGLRLIKSVVIEIGGQQIDKHYSDWLYIWNELSLPLGKRYAYDNMVGADKDILSASGSTLYIPLEFWFCRNVGLALPLIALQYHEVKVKIDFETKAKCFCSVGGGESTLATVNTEFPSDLKNVALWVDYIFLDTDERRRFAQLSHEYLIEQLQFTGTETLSKGSNRIKLNFNHPCKELIWVAKMSNVTAKASRWYDYTDSDLVDTAVFDSSGLAGGQLKELSTFQLGTSANGKNPFIDGILQLNGNDRFAIRKGSYFNYVQPYQHHTNIPTNAGINVYSFALKPEDHQPSGTLNMSRIDTATLMVNVVATTKVAGGGGPIASVFDGIQIYAVNYNVLRILSGMGGLAYSN
jgi:hypothetical protein